MNYDNVIACRYFASSHVLCAILAMYGSIAQYMAIMFNNELPLLWFFNFGVTLAKQWVMYHLFHCANTPYKFFVSCDLTCLPCMVGIYLCDKEKSTFTKIHPIPDLFERQ